MRDTRESGPMLEAALASGVAEGGGDAWLAGVLPTPGASILVRRHGLDLAAVVSASHNPWQHNGIKFFGADGRKLDTRSRRGSRSGRAMPEPRTSPVGRVRQLDGALDDYLRALLSAFRLDLSGRRVLLDCANGATYRVGAVGLRAPRGDGRVDRRRAGRAQHQRGLRLRPPGAPGRARGGRRCRDRIRLRRRRRPGDRGRRRGRDSRRRRADRPLSPGTSPTAAHSTAASP